MWGGAGEAYLIDQYNSTMEPVPTEFISPFLEHPTLVTPFEPTISSVDTFQPNQTSVTTIGDVYTYFSPIESIPTPLSDGYVDDSEPASLSYSERNDEGYSSKQSIRP